MRVVTSCMLFAFRLCGFAGIGTQHNDWLIVPGNRVGPLKMTSSRPELEDLFGKGNVEDKLVSSVAGPVTVVFPNDRSASLAILWQRNRVRQVMICYEIRTGDCKWHTHEGVTIGTGFSLLAKLNGRPFSAEPWGSDVGGYIVSWQGGKLAEKFGDRGNFKLLLNLEYQGTANTSAQQKAALDRIEMRREMSSGDLELQQLAPKVSRMSVFFRAENSSQ